MAKVRAARVRAASGSVVTQTGRETTTWGAGRPAFEAAEVMVGTMWSERVLRPTIQVMVPEACRAAIPSMTVPRAATRTGGAVAPSVSGGPRVLVRRESP